MIPNVSRRQVAHRGFYMIGLLLALVIIGILVMMRAGPSDPGQASNDKKQPDRIGGNACALNRQILQTHMIGWNLAHPKENPTIESLKASGVPVLGCPKGGTWAISSDGSVVYCSLHLPDPHAARRAKMESNQQSNPTPAVEPPTTPTPTPNAAGKSLF